MTGATSSPTTDTLRLGLAPPGRDALGRPSWSVTDQDVSRAFRRAAMKVHPDKFPQVPSTRPPHPRPLPRTLSNRSKPKGILGASE